MNSSMKFMREDLGSAATEFALLIPVFALLVFGIFNLCFLVYASSSLHWTVEQSARCAAISQRNSSLSCQKKADTVTYASSIYKGPSISPSFTASEDATCSGRRVAGTGAYKIRTGFANLDVPISATACYPATIDASSPWT